MLNVVPGNMGEKIDLKATPNIRPRHQDIPAVALEFKVGCFLFYKLIFLSLISLVIFSQTVRLLSKFVKV